MFDKMIKDKKAQISEGITWIVATIAIIIIILFSLFFISFVLKNKVITNDFFSDSINQKSFLSYLLTKESGGNGGAIYSKIQADENLDNSNGNLALKIFNGLYKEKYSEIWIGVSKTSEGLVEKGMNGIKNDFFGERPRSIFTGTMGIVVVKEYFSIIVPLKKGTFAEAIFMKKGLK